MGNVIIPSHATGFARFAGESEAPGWWKHLSGAWLPFLGQTGRILYDQSGYGNNGAIGGATTWEKRGPKSCLKFDAGTEYIRCPKPIISQSEGTVILEVERISKPDDYGALINVEADDNNSPNELIWWMGDTTETRVRFTPSSDDDPLDNWYFGYDYTVLPAGEKVVLAAVWKNGERLEGYRNGVLYGSLNGDKSWTADAWTNDEILWIGRPGPPEYTCNCYFYWVLTFDIALPVDQVCEMSRDPYRMWRLAYAPYMVAEAVVAYVPEVIMIT